MTRHRHYLCAICREIVCPEVIETPTEWTSVPAQSFEAFRAAVQDDCYICSVVWDLSRRYRHRWSQAPETWEPWSFKAYKDSSEDTIVKLRVVYKDPVDGLAAEAKFRLISVNDVEFKQQLCSPALGAIVSSRSLLEKAREWLLECLSCHPRCGEGLRSVRSWHPTRLIDVGDPGCPNWRLIVPSQDLLASPIATYLTLSYRWDPDPQILLLTSNMADLRRGNPISILPTLFQDLAAVAHFLSIRYLWIDALCIIQDSEDDREAEAPTMAHVYSHAVCNIAASAAESPADSLFFSRRDLTTIKPARVDSSLFSGRPRPHHIFDKTYWDRQLGGPLHGRGWVFQERFLSPRVLHFGRDQLLWECVAQHRCEGFPHGIPAHSSSKEDRRVLEASMDVVLPGRSQAMSLHAMNLWNDLVAQYSRCTLTRPSDRLLAMAGIAGAFQRATGDRYLAGLWESQFLAMLDWRVHDPRPLRCPSYRAPSWSWAAVDGPVKLRGWSGSEEFLVELLHVDVTTRTVDVMSRVLDGTVTLRGRLVDAVCEDSKGQFTTVQSQHGSIMVAIWPDQSSVEFEEGRRVSYLPLKLDWAYVGDEKWTPEVVCLILDRLSSGPGNEDRYRRLGHFTVDGCDKVDMVRSQGEIRTFDII